MLNALSVFWDEIQLERGGVGAKELPRVCLWLMNFLSILKSSLVEEIRNFALLFGEVNSISHFLE